MKTQKYPRTYHFPFSLGATSDDRTLQNWQAILAHPLIITEKLDGENTCLKTSGVYARSHAAPTRNAWAKNMWTIWERLKNDLGDLQVFGENLYGIHSIEYQELYHHFYIFGIRDNDTWLSWEEVIFYAQLMDLPTVPVRQIGHFSAKQLPIFIEEEMLKGSQLIGDCEGFVVRNAQSFANDTFYQNVLKYVRKNHVKTNEHWTRNWKRAKLWYEQASPKRSS